jgi:hypothetical protein
MGSHLPNDLTRRWRRFPSRLIETVAKKRFSSKFVFLWSIRIRRQCGDQKKPLATHLTAGLQRLLAARSPLPSPERVAVSNGTLPWVFVRHAIVRAAVMQQGAEQRAVQFAHWHLGALAEFRERPGLARGLARSFPEIPK